MKTVYSMRNVADIHHGTWQLSNYLICYDENVHFSCKYHLSIEVPLHPLRTIKVSPLALKMLSVRSVVIFANN